MLHVAAAAHEGYDKVLIQTNGSDVVVIAISLFQKIWGLKHL